jgi:hypothetical protein
LFYVDGFTLGGKGVLCEAQADCQDAWRQLRKSHWIAPRFGVPDRSLPWNQCKERAVGNRHGNVKRLSLLCRRSRDAGPGIPSCKIKIPSPSLPRTQGRGRSTQRSPTN